MEQETLENKFVWVIGASQGIGLEVGRTLGSRNAKLLVGARDTEKLKQSFQESASLSTAFIDVTDEQSVKTFVSEAKRDSDVDVIVYCAGVGKFGSLSEMKNEDFNFMFDTNVKGLFLLIREVLSTFSNNRLQVVVVTSDVSARPIAKGALYASSKHAQRALIRSVQMEYGDRVSFTEIRPGNVATNFAGLENEGAPSDQFLDPHVIANAILHILNQPPEARVDEIVLRPTGREILY